ncbi:MAG: DUF3842 family protein [Lachnospiraceae bacterium]
MVIDGQGGRIGSMFVEKWLKSGQSEEDLVVIGTNSIATSSMIKSGARSAATGENPVVVNAGNADFIVGPIGILAADALLGEVTPAMARAVASSPAKKVLIPMNTCDYIVMGVGDQKLGELIDEAVSQIVKKM